MGWSPIKKEYNLPRRRPDDAFERIYRHYFDITTEIVLSEAEKEKCEIYEKAWEKLIRGFSKGEIAKFLINEFDLGSKRNAYLLITQAEDLFGGEKSVDIDLQKKIFLERCLYAMRKCEESGQWSAYATINQTYAKIANFNQSTNELTEFLKNAKPITIVLTSDPDALRKEAEELVEDVMHEDMEGDGES